MSDSTAGKIMKCYHNIRISGRDSNTGPSEYELRNAEDFTVRSELVDLIRNINMDTKF
jgi:hypothetical protein